MNALAWLPWSSVDNHFNEKHYLLVEMKIKIVAGWLGSLRQS